MTKVAKKPGQGKSPKCAKEKCELVKKQLKDTAYGIKLGMSYDSAARAAGMNPCTFYRWKSYAKEGREPYASEWNIIEESDFLGERELLRRINEAGERGDWKADAWLLEKRRPKRYGKQENLSQTFIDKTNQALLKKTDEELEAEIKELEKEIENET